MDERYWEIPEGNGKYCCQDVSIKSSGINLHLKRPHLIFLVDTQERFWQLGQWLNTEGNMAK